MSRHVVAAVRDLPVGARKTLTVNGRPIVVFNVHGAFFGLLDRCPLQCANLSKGILVGLAQGDQPGKVRYIRPREFLRCPWHGWEFDIRTGQSWLFASQLQSLISEGIFGKFPRLRVVLMESGVTWLPAFMWRSDKTWRGTRGEVPWVKEPPSHLIREHVRLTVQPIDAPADPAQLERVVDQLNSEDMLLFSTDYPHWQFDGDQALPAGFPSRLRQRVLFDNPLATFPRLTEVIP